MQTFTLEELTKKPKVLSLEDLLKPRKPFTLEELQAKEEELLAKAQEKVKYKPPIDLEAVKPSKWTSEFWSMLGESFREQAGEEIFTKEFWTETSKNLIKQAAEMVATETISPVGKQRALVERGIQAYKALAGKEPPPGATQEMLGYAKSGLDFVTFIPKTIFNSFSANSSSSFFI